MCRKNILRGYLLIIFGVGVLIGLLLGTKWWTIMAGLALIMLGIRLTRRL